MKRIALALPLLLATCEPAYAADRVLAAHDGDTLTIEGEWAIVAGRAIKHRLPGKVTLRLTGIDTPEIGAKARCEAENALAIRARDNLRRLIAERGGMIETGPLEREKYGRLLGNPHRFAEAQIAGGFAVAYSGEGPRKDWCAGQPVNLLPERMR